MTTAKPLARYRATEGALASGFVTAQLHHAAGHDRASPIHLNWSIYLMAAVGEVSDRVCTAMASNRKRAENGSLLRGDLASGYRKD